MENTNDNDVSDNAWLRSRISLCLTIERVSFGAVIIASVLYLILDAATDPSGVQAMRVFLYVAGSGFVLNTVYLLALFGRGLLSLLEQNDKPSS